ncbi:hypothetical protein KY290_037557 [Solanum tuberosum]|uniref:N-acetyltransferase domain-containing protein n=1 Tax=Solanum tuberosum TaxID=4113 RepID=A0ABQ7TVV4_SOLTU|nr:hypothetical protein KY284_036908 [Solanum tuberosum]KAH0738852.1 hypothetical protein KY290_037557 [Solanum tuberosum]
MESDSSSIDLSRLNEELPVKIEEMLKLSNKEDDIISLRLLDLTDIDDFMEWFTDDNVNKFCSRDTTFITKEDAMQYIADVVIPHPWYRAICLNDKPIGSISVSPFHGSDICRGEIGYEISSKYWGKGIATKAVKMVASTIFVDWPHLARLEGIVAVDNVGSQRVLEKAGFIKEGVLRKYYLVKGIPIDIVMFSLLFIDQQLTYFT